MSGVSIDVELARDAVRRLQLAESHFGMIDSRLSGAIRWAAIFDELADAHMLIGELIDEVPALARTIEFKVEAMLAADSNFAMSSQFETWYNQARSQLTDGLNDRFHAGADFGGTYSLSYRGGFNIDARGVDGGRSLIENLLLTCGDGSLIAEDEFQIIKVEGTDRYIVVLAGVTDLSKPDLGLSDAHRSVRDLDQYAVNSARSSASDDNRYAVMVSEALREAMVPFGADITLVGHSYGADTALDLAASAAFNGGQRGYNVTHVVAAGYHSGPQLREVDPRTRVLVLQNHHDMAVLAEGWSYDANQAIGDLAELDVPGALFNTGEMAAEAIRGSADGLVDSVQFLGGSILNLGADAVNSHARSYGISNRVGKVDWGDFDDIFLLESGTTRVTDTQTVVVFEGDFEGAGHDPNNYAEHVVSTDDQATTEFFQSFSDAGYGGRMERWSVDVSVPTGGGGSGGGG